MAEKLTATIIAREFLLVAYRELKLRDFVGPFGAVVDARITDADLALTLEAFDQRVIVPLVEQALREGEASEWLAHEEKDTVFDSVRARAKFIPLGANEQLVQCSLVVPQEWRASGKLLNPQAPLPPIESTDEATDFEPLNEDADFEDELEPRETEPLPGDDKDY